MRWTSILAWLVASAAMAGPRKSVEAVDEQLGDVRGIDAVLAKAGWVRTPEGSDRYQAGSIFDGRNLLWGNREGCFSAPPTEYLYTALEVQQALTAGAKIPLGTVTTEASGEVFKKVTYADPMVSELEGRYLELDEKCRAKLAEVAKVKDVSSWYVVQAVLLAQVKEQRCTSIDAGVRSVLGDGGVAVSESCEMSTEGEVAVAYKTVPVAELLGLELAPPGETIPADREHRSASEANKGLFIDLDLGVPTGVKVGYAFGSALAVGARAGGGLIISSQGAVSSVGILAAFVKIGLGNQRTRLEPNLGVAVLSGDTAFLAGGALGHQFTDARGSIPGVGVRLGADYVPRGGARFGPNGSVILLPEEYVVPEAALTLSW